MAFVLSPGSSSWDVIILGLSQCFGMQAKPDLCFRRLDFRTTISKTEKHIYIQDLIDFGQYLCKVK
jgi:hypothetical protein